MTETTNKQHKLGLKSSLLICLAIAIIGVILQMSFGAFNIETLARPAGILPIPIHLVLLSLIIVTAIILVIVLPDNKVGAFLSGGNAALSSIISLAILALILGITTQYAHPHPSDLAGKLGIRNMTSFYPFVLIYAYLLICLVFAIIKRLTKGLSIKNIGFFFNHTGLLFMLYFIGAGASQVSQYSITTREGETEWRATHSKTGEVEELPIAINLKDFVMEEYPPKLAVVHRRTGKVQPESLPEYFDIDTVRNKGKLLHWEIEVEKFLPMAVRKDSVEYETLPMPGACPASLVKVHDTKLNKDYTSWISSGNNLQLYKFLPLGDSLVLAMTQAEPKRFYSDVDVYLKSGETITNKRIEVNKPMVAGDWMIYQSDYDKALGTSSITSIFDLVYDPWRNYEYISIILLTIGTVFMFWRSKPSKSNKL
ncbi:MAG: cytochrome c biogenesis protein ResB [Bacteroidales bacterium]